MSSASDELEIGGRKYRIFNVSKFSELGYDIESIPYSIRILIENVARNMNLTGKEESLYSLLEWEKNAGREIPFMPYRVLLQDYTGVPLVVDLAAMRDALSKRGLDPMLADTMVQSDLVIDHSIQVDSWAVPDSFFINLSYDYRRNKERYELLKWASNSFKSLRVFPPGKGICHQVNLEYIASVVVKDEKRNQIYPDTLIGTDSHTPMVNGLGVLGWGVGGIEAEAVMLGEPYYMTVPRVVGVELKNELGAGVTSTDLVLTITEKLRKENVVDCFVEYFGDGYERLTVPDRATISNMSPEYGATVGYFPVDDETVNYLLQTGRSEESARTVLEYTKKTSLFFERSQRPKYSKLVQIDLSKVEPSVSGPRNPEERVSLYSLPSYFSSIAGKDGKELPDGSVVIAAITSCTNTSNPSVIIGAAILAKKAYELGLMPKKWVKTSFAPGSAVVTDYLENSGLLDYLRKLGFEVVGYGCTTCIGNSGPLPSWVEQRIKQDGTYAVAVLSGNRNFDGRIHPLVKGSFLMSPILVVAYSLVGNINFDMRGQIKEGVYLKDIWPSTEEIKNYMRKSITPELYRKRYSSILNGDENWEKLASYRDKLFHWNDDSTYIRRPPWFEEEYMQSSMKDIKNARVLLMLPDKVTTDHISPAGSIPYDSPAGKYLAEKNVQLADFSTYGSRRGNHEVMIRGGFANIRLRNLLVDKEGWYTVHFPSGQVMSVYDAAMLYKKENVPLIVVAGKQYGTGSSRDWAAKVTRLLGIRAVIAESYERIHRSNLVAMGVIPLEFKNGESASSLGIKGNETFDINGIEKMEKPREELSVVARGSEGKVEFKVTCRVDNEAELRYIKEGGVLPYVFNTILKRQV